SATTAVQQDALQAAIWRTEYGDGFQLDGVDNDNGAPAFNHTIAAAYQADLAALGNNTAPVNRVSWISPGPNPGLPPSEGQGLVALAGAPVAPPGAGSTGGPGGLTPTLPPSATGARVVARTRKGVLGLKVSFNEGLNPASASDPGLYRLLG